MFVVVLCCAVILTLNKSGASILVPMVDDSTVRHGGDRERKKIVFRMPVIVGCIVSFADKWRVRVPDTTVAIMARSSSDCGARRPGWLANSGKKKSYPFTYAM